MRSSEQVKFETVLSFTEMSELVGFLAETKVDRLGYSNIRELSKTIKNQLGIKLHADDLECDRVYEIVALRNLIVHNRSRVDRRFKRERPEYPTEIGHRIRLDFDQCFDDTNFLAESVAQLDLRVVDKFNLTTFPNKD
jgi:hypothetical protein